MKADAEVQKAQDDVALLTARFDVRRAELDATGNEFIAEVEAQKNLLTLEEAKRRLAQLEEDVKSRAKTSQASLAVVLEKRNKAFLAVQRAQQVIDSLVVKAPIDGAVSSKENREGLMMFGPGMVIPEYREGDSVGSGRPVVDIIESGQMDVRAKVEESERSNLIAGQAASLHVDTIPGEVFPVRVGALSGSARRASYSSQRNSSIGESEMWLSEPIANVPPAASHVGSAKLPSPRLASVVGQSATTAPVAARDLSSACVECVACTRHQRRSTRACSSNHSIGRAWRWCCAAATSRSCSATCI